MTARNPDTNPDILSGTGVQKSQNISIRTEIRPSFPDRTCDVLLSPIGDHFADIGEMVHLGSKSNREIEASSGMKTEIP